MVSLNDLRTKFGVVLVVVIGAVLLAFVLGDLLRDPQAKMQNPIVGEIDGNDVEYSKFNAAYQEILALNGDNSNVNYDMSSQFISMAWQSLLFDEVLLPNLDKLGLILAPAEREALLNGHLSSDVLNNIFGDAGKYNPAYLAAFLEGAESNPQVSYIWSVLEKQILSNRVSNKYMDLVRNGAYANKLMLNKGLVAQNNTYKGHYVACNYSSVADSLVSVSDSEIEKYYEAHKAQYKRTPYRTVRYAYFENEPTTEDKNAVEAAAKGAATVFAKSNNLDKYVVGRGYITEESLSDDEAKALRGGKMFGPELRGDEWYASRVAESVNAPKEIELLQIALPQSDKQLADSLFLAVKTPGADFAGLAPQGSFAELGEMSFSMLPVELAKKLVNVRANDIVKIELGQAIYIFKVLKVGQKARHYLLATQTHDVVASKETLKAVHKEASDFWSKARVSAEGFDEAAASVPTSSMNVNKGNRNIPGLAHSLEVVRWANEANVGDVSDVIKLEGGYVVAMVSAIEDAEYEPIEKAAVKIKPILVAEKKAALLKEKMQGATLEEIATNAGSTVKEFSGVKTSSTLISGMGLEPRVIGALECVTADGTGKVLPLIEGKNGVYAVVVDEVAVEETQSLEAERVKAQAETESRAASRAMWAVQEAADIDDNTVLYF